MLELLLSTLDLLEVILLLTALTIITSNTVSQKITLYRIQSGLLAFVTGLSAFIKAMDGSGGNLILLILLIAMLPLLLAWAIKTLLARATLSIPPTVSFRDQVLPVLAWLFRPLLPKRLEESREIKRSLFFFKKIERDAEREWLRYKAPAKVPIQLLVFLTLVFVAFLIVSQIITVGFELSERIGLVVSLALHLIGLYNMVIKQDIISQVIGLLIMDHGLYLAVVKIVEIPVPATFFVMSLYFYTLITLFILVILLPRVRQVTASIDLTEISNQSNLKG
jgi:hydrogenase-4 membrane subunit HyfE